MSKKKNDEMVVVQSNGGMLESMKERFRFDVENRMQRIQKRMQGTIEKLDEMEALSAQGETMAQAALDAYTDFLRAQGLYMKGDDEE